MDHDAEIRELKAPHCFSRLSLLSACLWMLMPVAQAADRPSPYLKGVTTVKYHGAFEVKGHCAIDRKAWNTAIDFVANQSTKLKLITEAVHHEQFEEMLDIRSKTDPTMLKKDPTTWTDEDFRKSREAEEITHKHNYAPSLSFIITTIELESGCAAVINADVSTQLKSSEMIATGARVPYPDFSIWSANWTLQSSNQSFSRFAIETSEQIMKSFVNDWTKSQSLP